MDLLLLGTSTGVAGGLIPSPLHLIALSQIALSRRLRALLILVGLPLVIDGALLLITFFFSRYVPHNLAHILAYVGGVCLLGFGGYSLLEKRRKSREELARSAPLTYASVSTAILAEVSAPGTWVYWLGVAGPILAEGKLNGYGRVVPFFAGGLVGYYGAAILSVWLMAWGASLHRAFNKHLFLVTNLLLIVLGISYLLRAHFGG